MPEKRNHRGPAPQDREFFGPSALPALEKAVSHFSWLLSRGYAENSSLKLVGDRFELTARQRTAVKRCSCSDEALQRRKRHQVSAEELRDQILFLDGFNVITTVEAALAGGVILRARDGCFRDMASMHGSYRKVSETLPAIQLLGKYLAKLSVRKCVWYLDQPVSNSGRLKTMILEIAKEKKWNWEAKVVRNPDPLLMEAEEIVVSADHAILDRCKRWFNLARETVTSHIPDAWVI